MVNGADHFFNEGVNFNGLGRYSEALVSFDKAISIDPKDEDAWYNRGLALFYLRRYEEALDSYDKAIAIDPNDADSWYNRGNALRDLGQFAEALRSFDRTIAIDPNDAYVWNYRGLALDGLGRHEEALDSYDKAIAIDPTDADSDWWYNRGNALRELGRYADAVRSYNEAITINPVDADAWNSRGLALNGLGRYEESIASYENALEFNPNAVEARVGKGNTLKQLKRFEEAIAEYDRILQLDPRNESALREKNELLIKIHSEHQQTSEREDRKLLIERIQETETFGKIPQPIKDAVHHPNALLYPDEVIAIINQLDKFLTTARPKINLELLCNQIALSTWEKGKIIITNEGSAHAKDVTFKFSNDIDVRRIKTLTLLAGETKHIEMPIKAKVKGTIPLDVSITYHDACDKLFTDTFDFDVEVIEWRTSESLPINKLILPPTSENSYSPFGENVLTHHDVFISYSHGDKTIADTICATLESCNIRCWVAPRDVLPGEDYPAAIINAIEQCRIMVLVYSSKSNKSDHVTRELTKAVSTGAIIIPFRIEDIPMSKNMEYLIGIPHWLDALTPPLEHHIEKLVQTIRILLVKTTTN